MTDKTTIWYTRCPVPTASGIAFQRRMFETAFADTDYEVRNIKELGCPSWAPPSDGVVVKLRR